MKLCLFLQHTVPIIDLHTSTRTTQNKRIRRQSEAGRHTLHWNLEAKFSDAETRKLKQYYRQYRVSSEDYKEIKHGYELNNAYKLASLGHSISTTEEVNGKIKKKKMIATEVVKMMQKENMGRKNICHISQIWNM